MTPNRMAALPEGGAKRYIAPGDDVLFFTDIIDPGDISMSRGMEMMLAIWVRSGWRQETLLCF